MKSFVATRSLPTSSLLCPIMTLLLRLKDYRQFRSAIERVPIYCVFGDTVMNSIAQAKPHSLESLQRIRGFTSEKCVLYGSDILRLVSIESHTPPIPVQPSCVASEESVVLLHASSKGRWRDYHGHSKTRAGGAGGGFWAWGGKRRGLRRKLLEQSFPLVAAGLRRAIGGQKLDSPRLPLSLGASNLDDEIYVLELAQGRVYVGRSSNVRRRLGQHMSGHGSAFTQAFPPTGTLLPRLGRVTGSPEAAERDETLRYMFMRGIQVVRGWKYTRVSMPKEDEQDAEENIRELFDLCRRCGHPGHFMTQCKASFDRLGRACMR